jgi:hypothetical protein
LACPFHGREDEKGQVEEARCSDLLPIAALRMYSWRHFLDTINALITGDNDLLDARSAVTTRIVTVAEFAAEFGIS